MKKTKKIEDNIIKDVRNIYRMKKEIDDTAVKDTGYPFTLKNKMKQNFRNLFEHEEDYHKPVRAGNFWSNNYIEYKSMSMENLINNSN